MPRTVLPFFHLKCSMRAARALVGLRQDELAARTGLPRQTIILMEDSSKPVIPYADLEKVRAVLQKRGVVFIPETAELGPAVAITDAGGFFAQMMSTLGAARVLAGLRQDELAARAGITCQMIARIESGDQSVPVAALEKVRTALDKAGVAFLPETSPGIARKKKPRAQSRTYLGSKP
jgi:transcriptional regulator with XRE-family HTH domain